MLETVFSTCLKWFYEKKIRSSTGPKTDFWHFKKNVYSLFLETTEFSYENRLH